MKIEYIPNLGFIVNSQKFLWGQERNIIREYLKNQHTEEDKIIEMSEFFDGDTSFDIEQKRDIYHDINAEENYFFLNYDNDGNLEALEIHSGVLILIKDFELVFEKDINNYLKYFNSIGENYLEIEYGNFLFENLKMTIANSESMGGEGNGLSYFYSSNDIEHLKEE